MAQHVAFILHAAVILLGFVSGFSQKLSNDCQADDIFSALNLLCGKKITPIQPILSLFSSKSKLHGAHIRIQVLLLSMFAPQHTSVHLIFLNSHSSANWVTLQASTKQYNVTICERHRLIFFAQAGLCPAGPSACRPIKVLVGKVPRLAFRHLFCALTTFGWVLS